ncbi:YjfB family protein [Neobacillus jeddahensis]|uniref:YjfB family protein n=1 Tax=Neobacillus jeddahensis TaxID=1461580 RepID=UPI00058EF30E|nr:YjfB family protein [Neobacillus jeddahensis]
MDISKMSIHLNQSQLQEQASILVMKKAMDQVGGNADFLNEMFGQANIQAMQSAAQPHLGGNIDIKG